MSLDVGGTMPFDSLFTNIGTKAINVILLVSIILTGMFIAASASGVTLSTSGLTSLVGVSWLYGGSSTLVSAVQSMVSSWGTLSMLTSWYGIVNGVIHIAGGILDLVVDGYVGLAQYMISMTPPLLRPLMIMISTFLVFVQFCVYWVIFKFLLNLATKILAALTGGVSLPI